MIALVAIGNIAYAGGDLSPVTYYETNDVVDASIAYVESEIEPVIYHEPVYVESKPIVEVVPLQPKPRYTPIIVDSKPIPIPIPAIAPKKVSPSGFYAGLGITGSMYQSNCDCPTKDIGSSSSLGSQSSKTQASGTENSVALLARVGYDFNRYVGLEARGMKTVTSDNANISHVGLFVKPMLPVTNGLHAYGLVGLAKTKVTGAYQNVDAETLALGAGIEYDLSIDTPKEGRYSRNFDGQGNQEKGMGLFLDYERLVVETDAPELDTITAGLTYDF